MNLGWRVAPPRRSWPTAYAGAATRPGCRVVAVNGHSSSGKTTLAERLVDALPDAAVLHTDDLARNQGVFAWDVPLRDEVLPVVRAGEPLDYPPPQWWQARGRTGSVTLPGSLTYPARGGRRGQPGLAARCVRHGHLGGDRGTHASGPRPAAAGGRRDVVTGGYAGWMAEENAYTTAERPWEHADLLVYGGDSIPHDLETRSSSPTPTLSRPLSESNAAFDSRAELRLLPAYSARNRSAV